MIPVKIVPPDTLLDLEAIATKEERRHERNQRGYELGSIVGKIFLEGDLLTEVHAIYFAKK